MPNPRTPMLRGALVGLALVLLVGLAATAPALVAWAGEEAAPPVDPLTAMPGWVWGTAGTLGGIPALLLLWSALSRMGLPLPSMTLSLGRQSTGDAVAPPPPGAPAGQPDYAALVQRLDAISRALGVSSQGEVLAGGLLARLQEADALARTASADAAAARAAVAELAPRVTEALEATREARAQAATAAGEVAGIHGTLQQILARLPAPARAG